MWAICTKEFRNLFKSVKSIIVIVIIFGVTYLIADIMEKSADQLKELGLGSDDYAMGTLFIVFLLGILFISGLSHDMINREVSSRTMRFLVTKTTRNKIIAGKYLGVWFFWLCCIVCSFILISLVSKKFLWFNVMDCMTFISVGIAFTILFSVIIPKPSISMFFSIVFSLAFPALSYWSIYSNNNLVNSFKYLTPYYYSSLGNYFILINLVYALLVLFIALALFKRRDL